MQFGRTFEEFTVGDVYQHFPGRTLTESDNLLFNLITMNHHPLHLDANFAASTPHGQRVVVGTLTFSAAVGLSVRDISGKAITNLAYEEIKQIAPVFIGDTIYAESTILETEPMESHPDRGVVSVETRVRKQTGELVLTFRRRVVVPRTGHETVFTPPTAVP